MSNDKPAYPTVELDCSTGNPCDQHFGLTRRELFAAMIMAGSHADTTWDPKHDHRAEYSVKGADALIAELDK